MFIKICPECQTILTEVGDGSFTDIKWNYFEHPKNECILKDVKIPVIYNGMTPKEKE